MQGEAYLFSFSLPTNRSILRFGVKHSERRPHFLGARLLVLLILPPIIVFACSRDSLERVSMNEIMGLTVTEVISPAIADNLIGEKAQRVISVYLPPGYEETERSFPVLYYYPGFGQTAMYLSRVTPSLDDYFRKHPEDAFVIVGIDVEGVLRHSLGRNSAVTGRWKDFSAREVPQFIEDNFRVATQRGSTGIAGYSAGVHAGGARADRSAQRRGLGRGGRGISAAGELRAANDQPRIRVE